jgi:hypothetical protein
MSSASPPSRTPWRSRRPWRPGSTLAVLAGALVTAAVLATRRRRKSRPYRPAGMPADRVAAERQSLALAGPPPHGPPPDDPSEDPRHEDPPRDDPGATDGPGAHHEAAHPEPAMLGSDEDEHPRWPTRRWAAPSLAVAATLVVVTGLVVVRTVVADSETTRTDAGPQGTAGGETTSSTATTVTTTTLAPPDPVDAFDQARRRLETAGSFRYSGTAQATDVSHVRPGPWLATHIAVEGEVALSSNRLREVLTTSGGVAEIVADGSTVWARSATSAATLPEESYQVVVGLTNEPVSRMGVALLPHWLASATEHEATGTEAADDDTFSATIPPDDFGEIVRGRGAMAAEVLLTLDAGGDPVRVEIISVPEGQLHLVLDISDIGQNVSIDPPAG